MRSEEVRASAGDITADVQAYTLSARRLQVMRVTEGRVVDLRAALILGLDAVWNRELTLESEGIRADDLLDVTLAAGALVEAVAGVAAPPDQPPMSLPTVRTRPHEMP
jgi:hypothetical protein